MSSINLVCQLKWNVFLKVFLKETEKSGQFTKVKKKSLKFTIFFADIVWKSNQNRE